MLDYVNDETESDDEDEGDNDEGGDENDGDKGEFMLYLHFFIIFIHVYCF